MFQWKQRGSRACSLVVNPVCGRLFRTVKDCWFRLLDQGSSGDPVGVREAVGTWPAILSLSFFAHVDGTVCTSQ